MSLFDKALQWFGQAKSSPVERKVADMLSKGGVVDDKFPERIGGRAFVPGASYFGVRLSGLHMVDARRFATEQLPLCVCLAEFDHSGQRRSVPFSIGPDVIRQKLASAGIDADQPSPAWIELRDIPVVRPMPVQDGNLSLYVGLFSVPGDDLVKNLLNVVGTVGTALGQPAVSAGLKVADTIYNSFGTLLGLQSINRVVDALIGSALTEEGSGYLLVANVGPEAFDPSVARVVKGRLCWPENVKNGQPVVEFDHALLALEHYETIIQADTGMAPALFEANWEEVRKASSRETAKTALGKLQDAIAASPEITEADRIALLGGYATVAERLAIARWGPPKSQADQQSDAGTRGFGASSFKSLLEREAEAINIDGTFKTVSTTVRKIAKAAQLPAAWNLDDGEEAKDAVVEAAILDVALNVRQALDSRSDLTPEHSSTISSLVQSAARGSATLVHSR